MEVTSRRRSKSNSDLAAGGSARGHSEASPAKGDEAGTEAERWWLGECPDSKADETCHICQRSRFSSASTTTGLVWRTTKGLSIQNSSSNMIFQTVQGHKSLLLETIIKKF
jgi:hypothetical protein